MSLKNFLKNVPQKASSVVRPVFAKKVSQKMSLKKLSLKMSLKKKVSQKGVPQERRCPIKCPSKPCVRDNLNTPLCSQAQTSLSPNSILGFQSKQLTNSSSFDSTSTMFTKKSSSISETSENENGPLIGSNNSQYMYLIMEVVVNLMRNEVEGIDLKLNWGFGEFFLG